MVESYLHGLKNHAVALIDRYNRLLCEEQSSGYSKRCALCGIPHAPIQPSDVELRSEWHSIECADCGSERTVVRHSIYVSGDRISRVERLQPLPRGHTDCDLRLKYNVSHKSLVASVTHHTEEIANIGSRIELHHVSYEPEITIPLCHSCHGEVHSNNEYEELQPDMKRVEWEAEAASW